MSTHYGTTAHGDEYEIEVSRAEVFRCYDILGFERVEVCVEDGVITPQFMPEEMNELQARALAAMLMDAADAVEKSGGPRYELTDAGRAEWRRGA